MIRHVEIAFMVQIAQHTGFSYADILRTFYGELADQGKYNDILQAAKTLNYLGHPTPRSGNPSIGLITTGWPTDDYSGKLLQGIKSTADALGYDLTVHIQNINMVDALDCHFAALFELGYADQGFFMLNHDYFQISSNYCQKYNWPYLLGDCDANEDIATQQPSLGIDNRRAMIEIMRYLTHLGHKSIGYISGDPAVPSAYWRLQGYLDGLAEANLPVDESLIVEGNYWWNTAEDLTYALMQRTPPPTAIVSANDLMAIGAMSALRQLGYRIPEDVSLTGFDDIGMAMTFTPHLTTVSQPLVEMGRTAIEMLDKLIHHKTLDDPHRVFETQMVIRDSAQPPKNGNR